MASKELKVFERILTSLHKAALDGTRWSNASALINEAPGTHGSTLASGTESRKRTLESTLCGPVSAWHTILLMHTAPKRWFKWLKDGEFF